MSDDPLVNVEAEAALLGAMMIPEGKRIIDEVLDRVTAEAFAEPIHGRVFEVIQREHSRGKAATAVMLMQHFKQDEGMAQLGGPSYLARLTADSQGLFAYRDIAAQIAELWARRRLRAALKQALTDCDDTGLSLAQLVADTDTALDIDDEDDGVTQISGADSIMEMLDDMGRDKRGVACGQIGSVDDLLGPLLPGQFIVVAGRPGMGKTAFALSYAVGAAKNGHGVLYVSLEMSHKELSARTSSDLCFTGSHDSSVPYYAIAGEKLSLEQKRLVSNAAVTLRQQPFQIVDASALTTGRLDRLISSHARRMEAKVQRLQLVIVDYLQLLSADFRHKSAYESVSEISRALKRIAKQQGVTVMALAQLSRAVESRPDRRPQLSDLRDSGQIEQDADAVMFLSRPEYYHRLAEPERKTPAWDEWDAELSKYLGEIEFICAKRRNGRTGNAKGKFYGAFQAVRSSVSEPDN